jgi:hypothetical protein
MNKIIRIELLQQDIMLIKEPESTQEVKDQIYFFLDAEELEKVAYETTNCGAAFRGWRTEIGVKNLLVINHPQDIGKVSRVVLFAAKRILENKNVKSGEMEGLLLQLIMDNIYTKN